MRVDAASVMIFQALDDARDDLMLEAGIEVLGVFADDDHVDVGRKARPGTPAMFAAA